MENTILTLIFKDYPNLNLMAKIEMSEEIQKIIFTYLSNAQESGEPPVIFRDKAIQMIIEMANEIEKSNEKPKNIEG